MLGSGVQVHCSVIALDSTFALRSQVHIFKSVFFQPASIIGPISYVTFGHVPISKNVRLLNSR